MASKKTGGKFKPGSNVDFTPIIPKFLQGRMDPAPKRRSTDDSDDEDGKPVILGMPEGKERPDMEDEAPTIVADDEIMALLAKQEVVVADGKLERKAAEQESSKAPKDDSVIEFGTKSRAKKVAATEKPITTNTNEDSNTKKRPSNSNAETNLKEKREVKKKMLSFDDEEDI